MRAHRALGDARSPRSVDEQREIIGLGVRHTTFDLAIRLLGSSADDARKRDHHRTIALDRVHRDDVIHVDQTAIERREVLVELLRAVTDRHLRLAVFNDVSDLLDGVGHVDWGRHRRGSADAHLRDDPVATVVTDQCDPVARLHAERDQGLPEGANGLPVLAPRRRNPVPVRAHLHEPFPVRTLRGELRDLFRQGPRLRHDDLH